MRQATDNLYFFTRAWEDFSPVPEYVTADERRRGIRTIGHGHVIRPGESFTSISREQAMLLLRSDMAEAIALVASVAPDSLTQPQFEAMCDLVFNVGPKAIFVEGDRRKGFTGTGQALKNGDVATLRVKLPQFRIQSGVVVKGLVRRATGRLALFDGRPWQEAEKIGRSVP